jgi:thiosulfate dehydrogenase (quinone) large subunit
VLLVNAVVWIRFLAGAIWLNGALEKLLNPGFPKQFAAALQMGGFINGAPSPVASFMRGTVLPNAELFAQLTRIAELALGSALILGLLTNMAALGSVLYSLLILFTQGGVSFGTGLGSPEFFTIDLVLATISLIILLSPAAKAFSLDAALARRYPRISMPLVGRRVGLSERSLKNVATPGAAETAARGGSAPKER